MTTTIKTITEDHDNWPKVGQEIYYQEKTGPIRSKTMVKNHFDENYYLGCDIVDMRGLKWMDKKEFDEILSKIFAGKMLMVPTADIKAAIPKLKTWADYLQKYQKNTDLNRVTNIISKLEALLQDKDNG